MNNQTSSLLPDRLPTEDFTLPPSGHSEHKAALPQTGDPEITMAPQCSQALTVGDGRAPVGYTIEKELGRGGMGVVYLAHDVRLQRRCALKVILSGVHSGREEVERFRTEAQAIARLQHAGIVQVFEIGEHDGRPFMALEFCGGGSLDVRLNKNPLKAQEAATLVKGLANAVQAAHEANVIHRDLKPANVLLTERGEPKIADFGLAKKLDEDSATRTGHVMGTPSYMPPEQAEGKKDVGPAADIYALGAILYECLASRPPFRAATALDTILQVVSEDPVPLRRLNNQAPADLESIAHKCLQKDPKKRYASARELADDLGRFLDGVPVLAEESAAARLAQAWLSESRHENTLALFGRVWVWQAGVMLLIGLAVNSLWWFEVHAWLAYAVVFAVGLGGLFAPGAVYLMHPGRQRTLAEQQMDVVWAMFVAGAGVTIIAGWLAGAEARLVLPSLAVLLGFAVGATAVVLRGSLYLLAALCGLSSLVIAAFPAVGPAVFGTAFALGLYIPARRYCRLPLPEKPLHPAEK